MNASQRTDRLAHAKIYCGKLLSARLRAERGRSGSVSRIYVIQDGDCVKLGIASRPKIRLSSLQSGNPRRLALLKHWPTTRAEAIESRLHHLYRQHHVSGEWFSLPPDKLDGLLAVECIDDLL